MTLISTCFLGLDPTALPGLVGTSTDLHRDLFLEAIEGVGVRLEGGSVVAASREAHQGMALRSLSASGQTRLLSDTAVTLASVRALADELGGRAPLSGQAPIVSGALGERATLDALITLAQAADRIGRGLSPFVKEITVSLKDGARRTALAASNGALFDTMTARSTVSIEVVAERDGVIQTGFEAAGGVGERIDLELVERTVRLAAHRAIALLDARPIKGGAMPVVLAAEAGGTFVHEAVGHALEADAILEGMSWLEDRIGESVAAEKISVVDDPTLPGKNGSFLVDDEGVLSEPALCIHRGVLLGYLYDRRTASLLGARPNGKGRRESFRDRPVVRMSNTMILPGPDTPSAILEDTPSGLYVVRMGGGEVDTLTGNFVFEVNEAYRIEHGKKGELVRGATLTGSASEVLMSIDRVGSDLGFGVGICGKDGQDVPISDAEPTIRVPSLVVGGA